MDNNNNYYKDNPCYDNFSQNSEQSNTWYNTQYETLTTVQYENPAMLEYNTVLEEQKKHAKKKKINLILNIASVVVTVALIPVIIFSVKKIRNNMVKKSVFQKVNSTTLSSNSDLSEFEVLFDKTDTESVVKEMKETGMKEKVSDYFKEIMISSGVADEAEASKYVDFIMDTFSRWLEQSDGSEVEEFLDMGIVQEILNGTGLSVDDLPNTEDFKFWIENGE